MCGIAGVISLCAEGSASGLAQVAINRLKHRGPDGIECVCPHPNIAMAATRLAVEAPHSEHVVLKDGPLDLTLIYNGEIYNAEAIIADARDSFSATGRGDGEALLAAYAKHGVAGLAALDGMFAFCLWDGRKGHLTIGRDRNGIKPLFVSHVGGNLIVASEAQAVAAATRTSLDPRGLAEYITWRYIGGETTAFIDVKRIAAGCLRTYNEAGLIVAETLISPPEPDTGNYGEALRASVCSTMRSDSQIGIFLSGGLDSSAIAVLAAEAGISSCHFTIGYEGVNASDETAFADEVSACLGMRLIKFVIEDAEVPQIVTASIAALDEPLYSTVAPSTWALSRGARSHVKAVASGDGSDEYLCGYNYIRKAITSPTGRMSYLRSLSWLRAKQRGALFPWLKDVTVRNPVSESRADADGFRYHEVTSRLPDYHLARVDRLSMAHGLEVRLPFLRDSVTSSCMHMSAQSLALGRSNKLPLRELLKSAAPALNFNRPKQSFTAPIKRWIDGPLKKSITATLLDKHVVDAIGLNLNAAENLLKSSDQRVEEVWGLWSLATWATSHVRA